MANPLESFAIRIRTAREGRSSIDVLDESAPRNVSEAYAISLSLMDGAEPAAWKLGGTTAATRAAFGVSSAYAGPIKAGEVFGHGASLSRARFIRPVAEPEIAVGLDVDEFQASRRLRWVAPAIEIPDTVMSGLPGMGVNALLSDRCAAGALIIGVPAAAERLADLEASDVTLRFGQETVSAAPAGAIIDGVVSAVTEFLELAHREGFGLSGQAIVSTGGLSPAVPLAGANGRVSARIGSYEVALDWR